MTADDGVSEAFAELVENREAIIIFQKARMQGFRVTVSWDPDGMVECGFLGKDGEDKWDECGRVVNESLNEAAKFAWVQAESWKEIQRLGTSNKIDITTGSFITNSPAFVQVPGAELPVAVKTKRMVHVVAVAMECGPSGLGEFCSEYDIALSFDGTIMAVEFTPPQRSQSVLQHSITLAVMADIGVHHVALFFRRKLSEGSPIASLQPMPGCPIQIRVSY